MGTLTLKSGMWLEPEVGFCLWRDQRASVEWGAGIPELSGYFDTLEIPYVVRPEIVNVGKRKKPGFTLIVSWDDLPALTRWVPSFQRHIDRVRAEIAAEGLKKDGETDMASVSP